MENIELILVVVVPAISGVFALLGSLLAMWMNRDKTSAEARKTDAEAHRVRAEAHKTDSEAMAALLKSTSDAVVKFTGMIDKRDERIDVLERDARVRDELVAQLRIDLVRVTAAAAVKDKVIAEQNEQIAKLTERVNRLRSEREADQARISTLELEKVSLLKDADNDKNEPKNEEKRSISEEKRSISEEKPSIDAKMVFDSGDVVS